MTLKIINRHGPSFQSSQYSQKWLGIIFHKLHWFSTNFDCDTIEDSENNLNCNFQFAVMSMILKFVDSKRIQRSCKGRIIFPSNKKIDSLYIKGYNTAKKVCKWK